VTTATIIIKKQLAFLYVVAFAYLLFSGVPGVVFSTFPNEPKANGKSDEQQVNYIAAFSLHAGITTSAIVFKNL